ncbi:MAG: hypothetical protein NTX49_08055 [Chlamydiae bacterium]|nr:hypothetical protein [Chlamydiota bacterium]
MAVLSEVYNRTSVVSMAPQSSEQIYPDKIAKCFNDIAILGGSDILSLKVNQNGHLEVKSLKERICYYFFGNQTEDLKLKSFISRVVNCYSKHMIKPEIEASHLTAKTFNKFIFEKMASLDSKFFDRSSLFNGLEKTERKEVQNILSSELRAVRDEIRLFKRLDVELSKNVDGSWKKPEVPIEHLPPGSDLKCRSRMAKATLALRLGVTPIISEIQGVKFFEDARSCISLSEKTHWTEKALSFIQSFGVFFAVVLRKVILFFQGVDPQIDSLTNTNTCPLEKKRLVVCIHGLHSNPSSFQSIVNEMKRLDLTETDIFIPHVLQKGNAKLDDMVRPILAEIAKWAKTSQEKELVLIGVSNGGRIARAIEAEIAKSESFPSIKKLRFVSIVGACRGSSLAGLVNKVGLSWLISKNISEEMPLDSPRNRRLDQDWMEGLSKGPAREYTFFASPHDSHVPDYASSLMDVQGNLARYAIVPGYGHIGIQDGVAKPVAEIVLT